MNEEEMQGKETEKYIKELEAKLKVAVGALDEVEIIAAHQGNSELKKLILAYREKIKAK